MSAGYRFDPTILREYDIRGVVGETLSNGIRLVDAWSHSRESIGR